MGTLEGREWERKRGKSLTLCGCYKTKTSNLGELKNKALEVGVAK